MVHVRPAELADHPVFVRLFPELGVNDPVLDEERFGRELVPTTFIAETDGPNGLKQALGYAHFQIMKEAAVVRHLVTAPEARRKGVARELLAAILTRARASGCKTWNLNVKPENAAAISLYESYGMRRIHESHSLGIEWTLVEQSRVHRSDVKARPIMPEDETRVEAAMRLHEGQLSSTRAVPGRVFTMLEAAGPRVVGAAVFHPNFPGAYPFRVGEPELAFVMLRALRPYARPEDGRVGVVIEGQPEVARALLDAGAVLKLEMIHMAGPLP